MRKALKYICIAALSALIFAQAQSLHAQNAPTLDPNQNPLVENTVTDTSNVTLTEEGAPQTVEAITPEEAKPIFNPEEYPSLVFTYWENAAIEDARRYRGAVRPPSETELMRDLRTGEEEKVKPPPEEREIRLAGIVYRGGKDWTIWLNEQRVTPDAIPKEVMDLKVYKGYIEFKWFDEYSNKIFPIRLRPHQRFNIDTRIFLPG